MREWTRSRADQLYNWSESIVSLCIVNPFPNELNQFVQLDQTGRMQDGCLLKDAGVRRRRSLIRPLSRKGDCTLVVIEKREHFAATHSADLENQKPFSQQRVKRVSYGRPSQMVLGMECSLLEV